VTADADTGSNFESGKVISTVVPTPGSLAILIGQTKRSDSLRTMVSPTQLSGAGLKFRSFEDLEIAETESNRSGCSTRWKQDV